MELYFLNFFYSWRLASSIIQIPKKKLVITSKLYHLPRRLTSRLNKSFILCTKVGLGIGCAAAWNCIRVDCAEPRKARLLDFEEGSRDSPNFNWARFFQLLKPYFLQLIGAIAVSTKWCFACVSWKMKG